MAAARAEPAPVTGRGRRIFACPRRTFPGSRGWRWVLAAHSNFQAGPPRRLKASGPAPCSPLLLTRPMAVRGGPGNPPASPSPLSSDRAPQAGAGSKGAGRGSRDRPEEQLSRWHTKATHNYSCLASCHGD